MGHLFSRRDFLLQAGGAASTLGLALLTGSCESCVQQIAHRPIRRNIAHLAANDPIVETYKAAVSAMKALPMSDPRNWTNQASIHNNHCPHGNWFFLPWHRAYLLYFERICRKLGGNKDFALPYWNWTQQPSIPSHFWGAGNPLYDSTRVATASDVVPSEFVGQPVMDSILSEPNFLLFASGESTTQRGFSTYGELEATPHNNIHNFVGGHMATFMSPLDPVFWCHHNMIDCCWVDWNLVRHNNNTNDSTWMNFAFSDFVDEAASPVSVKVVTTLLMPILSYQYEPCEPGEPAPAGLSPAQTQALQQFVKRGAPAQLKFTQRFAPPRALTGSVGKPVTGSIKVEPEALRAVFESGSKAQLVLRLGGIDVPSKPEFFVRAFVNKPDATIQTPLEDPHYAGSFGFFIDKTAMRMPESESSPIGVLVNLSPTLRRLGAGGAISKQQALDIQLVAVPYPRREAKGEQFTLRQLELGMMPLPGAGQP